MPSRRPSPRAAALLVAAALAVAEAPPAASAAATPTGPAAGPAPAPLSADARLLRRVYDVDGPLFSAWMRGADATAYPLFVAAVPAAWLAELTGEGDDASDAWRLTATATATFVSIYALKRVVHRPRPFVTMPDIVARDRDRDPLDRSGPYSMPSGHAATAFALATSWSLSHPRWYVVVPAALWAGSVGLSRLWLGVHYPSDVLVGALLGAAIAVGAHLLIDEEETGGAPGDDPARSGRVAPGRPPAGPSLVFRVGF